LAPFRRAGPMMRSLAELYLTLSRAFLPPREEAFCTAFRADLAGDLEEITADLPFSVRAHLDGFRAGLAEVPDNLVLQQLYSRLFLTPPQLVSLNASLYLDGTLMGRSVGTMEARFAAHGLARAETFRDLSDHVCVQLEFLASLYALAAESEPEAQALLAEEARAFARNYLQPWSLPLAQRIAAACARHGLASPYAHLATLLAETLWEGQVPSAADSNAPHETPAPAEVAAQQQACRVCGAEFLPSREIAAMKQILAQRGLGTGHLDVCPDCRAAQMGLAALAPPDVKPGQ
jgi:putative dimethyl sulfoxide reductase chaperone